MMKRKLKSYVLLVICMLMLVAQVLPHHHHSEIFCLSSDLVSYGSTETCSGNMHHSDDADRHSCGSTCVTHFSAVHPTSICPTLLPIILFIPYFIR